MVSQIIVTRQLAHLLIFRSLNHCHSTLINHQGNLYPSYSISYLILEGDLGFDICFYCQIFKVNNQLRSYLGCHYLGLGLNVGLMSYQILARIIGCSYIL